MSIISLSKGLYDETRNITLFNSFEAILNQTESAKNNVIKLFTIKRDDLNNQEVTLKR